MIKENTITYTQSSTLSNTEYSYRLVAINLYGSSTSASFTQFSKPLEPTNVVGTATSGSEVTVSWNAVADPNNHGTTVYNVQRSLDQATWTTISTQQSGVSYADSGIAHGTA